MPVNTEPLIRKLESIGALSEQDREALASLPVQVRHFEADEDVVRTVASLAGFVPRVTHRVDSLDLVQDLIVAGLGVGLLPTEQPPVRGVSLRPLTGPDVLLRAYAVTRRGWERWPPLALVLRLLGVRPGRTAE